LEKYRISSAEINAIKWKEIGVLRGGNFELMYSDNECKTFGTGFMIKGKYKYAIMNFERVDDRICYLRIRGKYYSLCMQIKHLYLEIIRTLLCTVLEIRMVFG
jgi:hypothetical protein